MVSFSMVQAVHVESFLALDGVTAQAMYVAKLAGEWTFKTGKGERVPLGEVEKLSKKQHKELVEEFREKYVNDQVQGAEI